MTDLDLDAIKARRHTAENIYAEMDDYYLPPELPASLQDVPALVAEVERLQAIVTRALGFVQGSEHHWQNEIRAVLLDGSESAVPRSSDSIPVESK